MTITPIFAALHGLLIMVLAYKVIQLRRQFKVSLGDGGVKALNKAIAAHANATENIPIAMILLFLLEYNQVNPWFVGVLGLLFFIGRLLHGYGTLNNFKYRILGMQITVLSILLLCVGNIGWVAVGLN